MKVKILAAIIYCLFELAFGAFLIFLIWEGYEKAILTAIVVYIIISFYAKGLNFIIKNS